MQSSKFFDNQIIKVQNLEFLRDSTEKNIVDNFMAFTKQGGITQGLNLYSGTGLVVNISPGVAYDNTGQRMELYSGISFVAASGMLWASVQTSDYNPDPASTYASFPMYAEAQSNINPVDGSVVNVSTFNTMVISQTSGAGCIPLGRINATNSNIVGIDSGTSYRQNLTMFGVIDVNTSSINGNLISLNSIDSNRFVYPLHYDFAVSGVNIFNTVSGAGNIGSAASPFASISAKTLNVTNISGLSPITLKNAIFFDTNGENHLTTKNATSPIYVNYSGQDTYIGGGLNGGKLFTNTINAWAKPSMGPSFPGLSLQGAGITMTSTGFPGNYETFIINSVGGIKIKSSSSLGTVISGQNIYLRTQVPSTAYGSYFNMVGANPALGGHSVSINANAPGGGGTVSIYSTDRTIISTAPNQNNGISLTSPNITIASGTLISNVNYSATRQQYENLVVNPEMYISNRISGNQVFVPSSGVGSFPDGWSVTTVNPSPAFAGDFKHISTTSDESLQWFYSPVPLFQAMQGLASYTIEFQFKLHSYTSLSSDTWQEFYFTSDARAMRIEGTGSSLGNYSLKSFGNGTSVVSSSAGTTPINLEQWYSAALTVSGTSGGQGWMTLFIDNKLVAPSVFSNNTNFYGDGTDYGFLTIGAYAWATTVNGLVNGNIANYRISNFARPSGTFASGLTTYQPGGTSGVDTNTLAYWRFDGSLNDSTSNRYDLLNMGRPVPLVNTKTNSCFETILQDYSVDSGLVNIGGPGYHVLISGTNFDTNGGILSVPVKNLKPNTKYNVSYYYNSMASAIIYATSLGGSSISTVVDNGVAWARRSVVLTTPSTLTDSKLTIKLSNFGATGNATIKLGGVQVTEGSGLLPYQRTNSKSIIYNQSSQYQYMRNKWRTVQGWDYRNIYVEGGRYRVAVNLYIQHSAWSSSTFKILVDNKEVASKPVRDASGEQSHSFEWVGDIDPGFHSFKVIGFFDQATGSSIINFQGSYFSAISTFEVSEL